MQTIWAAQALTARGWQKSVQVMIDEVGRIVSVKADQPLAGHRVGILLPAPVNAHSHGFQRAMAGLTEARGADGQDSFWTWRQLMYHFLDQLTPDDVEAITAFAQMEMLEAGYGASVEFHYLHHGPDGRPFEILGEMSEKIMAAAAASGIGLTLLPVLYQQGGCDGRSLGPGQRRFGNDPGRFASLVEEVRAGLAHLPVDARLGIAAHSLRAVPASSFADLVDLAQGAPVHMHLAEQTAEVEEVCCHLGARPVEWLLDHVDIDARWCLVHCTQMEPEETRRLAETGAVAGLCPITEANLGDGIFDGVRLLEHGGALAIGSDSNIRIALAEELRTLEYGQRLRDRRRAVLATATQSTGRFLFEAIIDGGARAAGRETGCLKPGHWADLLALDAAAVDLVGQGGDAVLDCFLVAGDQRMVTDVWSAGRHLVVEGRHRARAAITGRYLATTKRLRERL